VPLVLYKLDADASVFDCEPGKSFQAFHSSPPRRGRIAGSPYLFTGLFERSVCHGRSLSFPDNGENATVRAMNQQSSETATLRRRVDKVERQIRNCTEAIATMGLSNSLRVQLTDLETEHQEFTEKLESFEPRTIRSGLWIQGDSSRRSSGTCSPCGRPKRGLSALRSQSTWRKSHWRRKAECTSRQGPGICSEVWLLGWCRGPGLHHAYHGV
jgi:hypothetical protein